MAVIKVQVVSILATHVQDKFIRPKHRWEIVNPTDLWSSIITSECGTETEPVPANVATNFIKSIKRQPSKDGVKNIANAAHKRKRCKDRIPPPPLNTYIQ